MKYTVFHIYNICICIHVYDILYICKTCIFLKFLPDLLPTPAFTFLLIFPFILIFVNAVKLFVGIVPWYQRLVRSLLLSQSKTFLGICNKHSNQG